MPNWPAGLVFTALVGTYNEEPVDGILRTAMSTGPNKTRPRYTATPTNLSFTLPLMTPAEFVTFRDWFKVTVSQGTIPFDANHPITGEANSFKFLKPYNAQPVGLGVSVQVELEMLP